MNVNLVEFQDEMEVKIVQILAAGESLGMPMSELAPKVIANWNEMDRFRKALWSLTEKGLLTYAAIQIDTGGTRTLFYSLSLDKATIYILKEKKPE